VYVALNEEFVLKRLNGWQRLYVVIILFFYTPLVFVVGRGLVIPAPSIQEIAAKLPAYSKRLSERQEIRLFYQSLVKGHFSGDAPPVGKIDWDKVVIDGQEHQVFETVGFGFEEKYGFWWDVQMDVLAKIPEADLNAVGREVYETVERAHSEAAKAEYIDLALMAFALAAVVYVFGYALGWIYRGFKKN
jgi:hypothetical protein